MAYPYSGGLLRNKGIDICDMMNLENIALVSHKGRLLCDSMYRKCPEEASPGPEPGSVVARVGGGTPRT